MWPDASPGRLSARGVAVCPLCTTAPTARAVVLVSAPYNATQPWHVTGVSPLQCRWPHVREVSQPFW